ncbi:MAG: hypothetical protein ACI8PZ_003491 [Myxococcota bacterium]|jgi:hypothetical protein
MRTIFLALLLPTTALAGGPVLSISGACPGPMAVSASGFTPGARVAVLNGRGLGSDVMPAGPCAGGGTDLSGLSFVTTVPADGRGGISATPTIGGPLCGTYIQFVDTMSCAVSNPVQLGADCENLGWHQGPGSPEGYAWSCPPGTRMPDLGEWDRVEACMSPDDLAMINYYNNVAVEVGGCNCKWNASWCSYESIETFDGRMCGDFEQLHICVAE